MSHGYSRAEAAINCAKVIEAVAEGGTYGHFCVSAFLTAGITSSTESLGMNRMIVQLRKPICYPPM
jgi:hypothetical protein